MPPKPLFELASAIAIKNIKSVLSIGYLPYKTVRHILSKVDSAPQLRQIELNCPQLQGETGELWLRLIEKDFPMEFKAKGYMPKSDDKWHKVWEKYKRDHDRSLQESEEQLKNALMGLRQDKEKNTSKIVEGRYLPGDAMKVRKRHMGPKDNTASVLNFGGGSRTKTLSGAGVMRKARREAREVRNIQGSLSRSVAAPIRLLERQHLRAPPPAMVHERRIAAQPAYRTPENEQREQMMEQRRNAALDEHAARAAYITDSEDDSDDDAGYTYKPQKTASSPPKQGGSSSSAAPARKVVRSGGSMFQRKFGGGGGKPAVSPQKQTVRVATSKSDLSPATKKRSSSQASLGESSTALKRNNTEPPAPTKPLLPQAAEGAGSAEETVPAPKPVVMRKKKPASVFMKRPTKR